MHSTLSLLFLLLVALNALDAVSTIHIILKGGEEKNPLLRPILQRLGVVPGLVLAKVVSLAIIWVVVLNLPMQSAVWMLAALIVCYIAILAYNIHSILKQ